MVAESLRLGEGLFRDKEELGYPHELILFASSQTEAVIEGHYRTRVKLLANLLRSLLGHKLGEIEVPVKADLRMHILESLVKTSLFENTSKDYRHRFNQLIQEYSASQSSPSLENLEEFVEDGVFLHILSKEKGKMGLFSSEDIVEAIKVFNGTAGGLAGLLTAVRAWETLSCGNVSTDVVNALASVEKESPLEAAIFLSYALALHCSNKRELLVVHYQLVRRAVITLSDTTNQENLSDEILERIFRVAIALFLCGYLRSLRLPHEEKIRYVDEIIKSPSIEQVIGEIFDSTSGVSLPRVESKVPLWVLALADVVLMFLHWTVEIQRPFETSVFGVTITIPAVPVFLLFALVVSLILFWRLLYLKRDIIKSLRRGNTD